MEIWDIYCDDVLNRKILACDAIYKACKRFRDDFNNPMLYFDVDQANRVIGFIQTLKFTEQEYLNQNFILEGWQSFIVANIFGWYKTNTKQRRYKKAFIFTARGNGKSPLAAAIGMSYLLMESGAQVYSISTNYQQSAIVYNYMKNFILRDDTLKKIFTVYSHSIFNEMKQSVYKPLSSTYKGFDGFSPNFVIADEIAAMANYDMLNVFTTALHKKVNSLLFMITTANYINESTPALVEYKYAKQLLDGAVKDDEYFALIYELDSHDDYKNKSVYVKANPASFVKLDLIEKSLIEASNKREMLASVLTKNLNVWVKGAENSFVDSVIIAKCRQKQENNNIVCISIGADFSNRRDLTSITFAFLLEDGKISLKHLIFTSNRKYWKRPDVINKLYEGFISNGYMIECNDDYIDKDLVILTTISEFKKLNYNKRVPLYYDEAGSIDYIAVFDQYFDCLSVRQNLSVISEHTKNYEELLAGGKIIDNNECALWQLGNATIYSVNNLMRLSKKTKDSEYKIDTCVSSLLALIGIKAKMNAQHKVEIINSTAPNENIIDKLKALYQ